MCVYRKSNQMHQFLKFISFWNKNIAIPKQSKFETLVHLVNFTIEKNVFETDVPMVINFPSSVIK